MNKEKLLELFNKHMRIEITYPGSRVEQAESVVRQVSLSNERGFILFQR